MILSPLVFPVLALGANDGDFVTDGGAKII
jgi:hypothetical protein